MAGSKLTIKKIKFNKNALLENILNNMQELILNAAAEYVNVAANRANSASGVQGVPVDSGMAKGSFKAYGRTFDGGRQKLNEYLGIDIPIARKKQGKSGRFIKKRRFKDGTIKDEHLGAKVSEYAFNISKGGRNLTFEFNSDVWHYTRNDTTSQGFKNGQKATPWRTIAEGRKAFEDYMNDNFQNYRPRIKDFIIIG